MIAFHNDEKIKEKYLERVRAHARADEIVKGQYWKDGKGCAVGCTIHSDDHTSYETELGIPEWLARLEDTLFEGMPNEQAKLWPEQFLAAIKPGVDLEQVRIPLIIFILEQNLISLDACEFDRDENPEVVKVIADSRAAVVNMIRCHREGLNLSAAESAARSAAESAAWSAESAAYSAAWSAARSAESAAQSAARSAESAAWSAESAAYSAAWSTWSAAYSAQSAARSATFVKYADKLLVLLSGAV